MTEEAQLLAAIAAEPDDESLRLVYADWLIACGDPRGELIVLDHLERTTPGGLVHPDQIASLLRLAAELGFPHLPDPDAALLAFEQVGRGDCYRTFHGGHAFMLHGGDGISLQRGNERPIYNPNFRLSGRWSDPATNVILTIALGAIRDAVPFERVVFPRPDELQHHPAYRFGPFPMCFSGELVDSFESDYLLRARDHARWYALYNRLLAT